MKEVTEKSWRFALSFKYGPVKVEFEMARKKIEAAKQKPSRKPSNRKKPR